MSPDTLTSDTTSSSSSSSSSSQGSNKDRPITQNIPPPLDEPHQGTTPRNPQLLKEALTLGQEDEKREEQAIPVPPDGGWGWMVAAGVFLTTVVAPMLNPSFGILFSEQLQEWRSSSTTVAIIYNAFRIMWKLTGVVVGTLTDLFGFRRIAMIGTLLSAVSLILCAFATSPQLLFLFFSFGCGLGTGLACVGFLILAKYFDKRRGMANTLFSAGVGLGMFISPIFIRYLQVEYGSKGATMILGAFFLHAFLGTCLYQPVEWHMKYPKSNDTPQRLAGGSCLLGSQAEENADFSNGLAAEEKNSKNAEITKMYLQRVERIRLESQCSYTSLASHHSSSEYKTKSTLDIASMASSLGTLAGGEEFPTHHDDTVHDTTEGFVSKTGRSTQRVLRSVVKDMSILKTPTALIIAVGTTLIINVEASFILMVPFFIQAEGHSLQMAAWCVSFWGICSLTARLVVSPLSDYPWFKMKVIYLTSIAAITTSMIVFTFQTEMVWLATAMGLWGCSCGLFHGLNNLYMTRIVGVNNLTAMFGARNLMIALGFVTIGPLVGVVRDVSDSYAVSMWVLSCLMLVSLVLWLLMPFAVAYEQRKKDKLQQKGELP